MSGAGAAHLVTGATGPLGAAIALRLLECGEGRVYCITRGATEAECAARMRAALRAAAGDRGFDVERCLALPGDVTAEGCGVEAEWLPSSGPLEVWHCAEDRRSAKRHHEEVEGCNVAGTANVIALSRRLGAARFNLLGSARAAGTSVGPVAEAPLPSGQPVNDPYEGSKREAEMLALAAGFEVVRLLRPATVVADPAAEGPLDPALLAFSVRLLGFRREVEGQLGDYFGYRQLTVAAAPETPFWLSPVDLVAGVAVRLAAEGAPGGARHLVASDSPTLGEVIAAAFAAAGMLEPRFSEDPRQLNRIDEAFNRSLRFHHPSWLQAKELEHGSTAELLGAHALVSGVRGPILDALLAAHLEAAREQLGEPTEGVVA